MQEVAIVGGAFNPPHKSHRGLCLLLESHFDEVWFQPCYDHTYGKKMVDAEHRTNMCKLACRASRKIKVSSFEIDHQITGGTYQVMLRMLEHFPKIRFFLAIGQDNADTIDSWVDYQKLIKEFPFVVVPRSGYLTDFSKNKWYNHAPHKYLAHNAEAFSLPAFSSTEARKCFENGEEPSLVSKSILNYIKKHKLYH